MRLAHATWYEVEAYLAASPGIILPTGSTEQHGPIGLIGTDALCAELIALGAADRAKALVAPTLSYTPAPFNTAFPGTMSLSVEIFEAMVHEILTGLHTQGFTRIYILNGHGANLAALNAARTALPDGAVRIKSWWDFDAVNVLRAKFYGDWEGMHATPSEIAMTRAAVRIVEHRDADTPPKKLSPAYMKAHAGDKHGPPARHRADFPDGRVGSHSALATAEQGAQLLDAAGAAVATDFLEFVGH